MNQTLTALILLYDLEVQIRFKVNHNITLKTLICCDIRYYLIIYFVLFLNKSCDLLPSACLWGLSVLQKQKNKPQTAKCYCKAIDEETMNTDNTWDFRDQKWL